MHIKKILAAVIITLSLASCGASPEEQKELYFEKMQEYGVDKSEAIDVADTLCNAARNGIAEGLMQDIRDKGGRFAENVEVVIEYGIPVYCPKFVDDFKKGQDA